MRPAGASSDETSDKAAAQIRNKQRLGTTKSGMQLNNARDNAPAQPSLPDRNASIGCHSIGLHRLSGPGPNSVPTVGVQYPGGIILQKEFEPQIPEWRVILGAAGAVRPIYDGALPYRVQPGPVIDIRYRDIAFASVGEGLGVSTCNCLRVLTPASPAL
jgi:hypothetical protein